jgi:DNA-binding XRE family transcriptional regulator
VRNNITSTLREYRLNVGWSQAALAQHAGLKRQTVAAAERGEKITPLTAKKIADALSEAYGQVIRPLDIEDLAIE